MSAVVVDLIVWRCVRRACRDAMELMFQDVVGMGLNRRKIALSGSMLALSLDMRRAAMRSRWRMGMCWLCDPKRLAGVVQGRGWMRRRCTTHCQLAFGVGELCEAADD